jgi:hypothetical protein
MNNQVVQYVKFRQANVEEGIRANLKERIDEAIGICQHIYDRYHSMKSKAEFISKWRNGR